MRTVARLMVRGEQVPVVSFDLMELANSSLEGRIKAIRESVQEFQIVICEVDLERFLAEEQADERARLRKTLLDATSSLIHPAQLVADSIEDVRILIAAEAPPFLGSVTLAKPSILVIPVVYVEHLDLRDCNFESFQSTPWKTNTINVFELENRFDDEIKDWQFYDSSRLLSRRQGAGGSIAKAMGLDEQFAQMERGYTYAHAIGDAVGREHGNQWLAMDLKLEHFIHREDGGVSHVDHSDDVFLLRQPTEEECAKSIAPLYQQMAYQQWHAFREGYFDARRRPALDVLLILEDARIGEILGCRAIANAVQARNEDDPDEAFAWCEAAEAAFKSYQEAEESGAWLYLCKLQLVRGDVRLYGQQFGEALALYEGAVSQLEARPRRGAAENYEIASAMINSAAALDGLNRSQEARSRLVQAKRLAAKLPRNDPRAKFLVDVASKSLDRLKQRR